MEQIKTVMTEDASPLLVLQARAEARAILYAACECELDEAITPLTRYALDSGIVDQLGAERAYAIIKTAFAGVAQGVSMADGATLQAAE